MKLARILAVVGLTLMSLMNIGFPFSGDPKPALALAIPVLVLGLAGLVAASGLARSASWGIPAALVVAGVNVVGAVVALIIGSEGATIGLVVSATALVLTFVAGSARRQVSPA